MSKVTVRDVSASETTTANPSRKTGFRPRAASSRTWVRSSAALRARSVFRAPWPPYSPGPEHRLSRRTGAFTLLEVMAAVLIAGLMLTSLYASEAGSIKMKQRAINMSLGALLVRCKMGEIEELIAEEGLPAVFASESDACCAEAEIEGFQCDWEINRIVLPETMFMGDEEGQEDMFSQQGTLPDTTEVEDPTALLSGPASGEIDALASQAMQFVYPVLKPSIEEQIRRVTIVVRWREGAAERSFSVNRYLVAEQPPPLPEDEEQPQ